MYPNDVQNLSLIYLDEKQENFSNLSAGFLIKAIGEGKKIAYIDFQDLTTKLTNFIENISLSYSFIKSLPNFQIDIYKFKQNNTISKTLIPQVEFSAINPETFWNSLNNYNLIILENLDLKLINKIKLLSLLKNKNPNTNIIAITKNNKDFELLKNEFNKSTKINYKENNSLIATKGLTNILGKGYGKTSYSIGYLIRKFISKNNVKLIYFDKGDDVYGDAIFFSALKKWTKENNFYGTFDFVKTGIKRHYNNSYREDQNELDKKEAKDALMLLKTSLKKQSPVIADELNLAIQNNLLSLQEVLPILQELKEELIITGENSNQKILDLSQNIINLE